MDSRDENAQMPAGRAFIFYMIITALITGAAVMLIEVLGSRLIGPVFGVSLFVWTSLIAVTLIALAAGYMCGGWMSDRKPSPDYMYAAVLIAGVLTVMVPAFKAPVLRWCVSMGLRTGSFVGASVLLGPPLFMLGMVSPYLIRLASHGMRGIGVTVGMFYSISTLGSFAGTLMTGFYLMAHYGVRAIFIAAGAGLILTAVLYFAVFRRLWIMVAFLSVMFLIPDDSALKTVSLANGASYGVEYQRDTFYGALKVIGYKSPAVSFRGLLLDGQFQGGMDVMDRRSVVAYSYLLEIIPYEMNPSGRRCLVLGLGAGLVPLWYESHGVTVDVVEINPAVVGIAKEHFGFNVSGGVYHEDARYYLSRNDKPYDFVVLDVFNGDTMPSHLLSREALALIKKNTSQHGVLAVNFLGEFGGDSAITGSLTAMLKGLYNHVEAYPLSAGEGEAGNIVLIATDGYADALDMEKLIEYDVHPIAEEQVWNAIGKRTVISDAGEFTALTDDFNPADYIDIRAREHLRENIISGWYIDALL